MAKEYWLASYGASNVYVAADWAEAACQVEGDWHGRQVADFCHDPGRALEAAIENEARESGEDTDDEEIQADIAVSVEDAVALAVLDRCCGWVLGMDDDGKWWEVHIEDGMWSHLRELDAWTAQQRLQEWAHSEEEILELLGEDLIYCECAACDCEHLATTEQDDGTRVCDECTDSDGEYCGALTEGWTRCPHCGEQIEWGQIEIGSPGYPNQIPGRCGCESMRWNQMDIGHTWRYSGGRIDDE